MGLSKCRIILGKKVTGNPESDPAHRAAGMAELTWPGVGIKD